MRTALGMTVFVILSSGTLALAQIHIAGTAVCSGPEETHVMRLSDHPDHFFVMSQGKCNWTRPVNIEGTHTQNDVATSSSEIRGNRGRLRGYVTETTAGGDKFSYRIVGEQILDHGRTVSEHGRWTIVSGTGRLKGIHGKGTYTGKLQGGGMAFDLEGEYQAAARHRASRRRKTSARAR